MSVEVQRHKTAIGRPALSLPAKLLFQSGLVTDETSVLDYGCGRGDDVQFLKELGIPAVGWDPHFIPDPALLHLHGKQTANGMNQRIQIKRFIFDLHTTGLNS